MCTIHITRYMYTYIIYESIITDIDVQYQTKLFLFALRMKVCKHGYQCINSISPRCKISVSDAERKGFRPPFPPNKSNYPSFITVDRNTLLGEFSFPYIFSVFVVILIHIKHRRSEMMPTR